MEKSPREEDEQPAPPYEESNNISRPVEKSTHRSPRLLTAQERAAELRQQRVKLLVDGHIEPLLETAILHGNSQSIIVIPSDSIQTSAVLTLSHLVHRPKTSTTRIVQLQGPNSTAAFWMQSKVVEELENAIRGVLYGMDYTSPPTESLPPRPADHCSPVTGQKSWLERTFAMPGPDHDPTGSTGDWKLGWRSENANPESLISREHGPSVRMREIAFRTETELGLLTTTTAKCIVIELESSA
jgi:hypothetical protein